MSAVKGMMCSASRKSDAPMMSNDERVWRVAGMGRGLRRRKENTAGVRVSIASVLADWPETAIESAPLAEARVRVAVIVVWRPKGQPGWNGRSRPGGAQVAGAMA